MNGMTSIWLVMDGDYDGDWVVAAYDSESLAQEHSDRTGQRFEHVDLLNELSVEAVDTREQRAEALIRQAEIDAENRRQYERTNALTITDVISRGGKPRLCRCETFSKSTHFRTPHGYCRYCGGWIMSVFRMHCGEAALASAIDELALPDRIEMHGLAGWGDEADPPY